MSVARRAALVTKIAQILPASPPTAGRAVELPAATPHCSGVDVLRAQAILVVDDEEHIRSAVGTALQPLSVSILEAATGVEGLALAAARNPDLIVLDLGLPDLPGDEVCRAIRQRSSVPIVVLSARHSVRVRRIGPSSRRSSWRARSIVSPSQTIWLAIDCGVSCARRSCACTRATNSASEKGLVT